MWEITIADQRQFSTNSLISVTYVRHEPRQLVEAFDPTSPVVSDPSGHPRRD